MMEDLARTSLAVFVLAALLVIPPRFAEAQAPPASAIKGQAVSQAKPKLVKPPKPVLVARPTPAPPSTAVTLGALSLERKSTNSTDGGGATVTLQSPAPPTGASVVIDSVYGCLAFSVLQLNIGPTGGTQSSETVPAPSVTLRFAKGETQKSFHIRVPDAGYYGCGDTVRATSRDSEGANFLAQPFVPVTIAVPSDISLWDNESTPYTVVLSGPAPSGGQEIFMTADPVDYLVPVTFDTATWSGGATTGTLILKSAPLGKPPWVGDKTFNVFVQSQADGSTVGPSVGRYTVHGRKVTAIMTSPAGPAASDNVACTIAINAAAPAGGTRVGFQSLSLVAGGTASKRELVVPAGATSTTVYLGHMTSGTWQLAASSMKSYYDQVITNINVR
ncbi:MAG: hypothetical protein ACRELY_22340 [Polyangiaceae bacterium]